MSERYSFGPAERTILPGIPMRYLQRIEETWDAYKQESWNKDPAEFVRLYDRLSELRKKIDELQKEARHR